MAERWEIQCYESGTMIVRDMAGPVSDPHLYVYGPGGETEDDCVKSRFQVCEDLVAFLNGGKRFQSGETLTKRLGDGTNHIYHPECMKKEEAEWEGWR